MSCDEDTQGSSDKPTFLQLLSIESCMPGFLFIVALLSVIALGDAIGIIDSYLDNVYEAEITRAKTELVKAQTEQILKTNKVKLELIESLAK